MRKIYIICSVRKLIEEEKVEILAYVDGLEEEGCAVRCPFRDTNQNDEIGLRIVEEHEDDIIWADEIHIVWNPGSEGSLWDGKTFHARKENYCSQRGQSRNYNR